MDNSVLERVREQAKARPKRIVFPEAWDERVVVAAKQVQEMGIAEPIMLHRDDIDTFEREIYANFLCEKKRNLTYEKSRELMESNLFFAAMMVRLGLADGMVAGAASSTADVMRAVIYCMDVDERVGLITSCFLMAVPGCSAGEGGLIVFADCGVIPSPTSEQLAKIALASAFFMEEALDIPPRVAMLSYSSKGSANHEDVTKVKDAVQIAQEMGYGIPIDGEMQVDSAIVPEIAAKKMGDSPVAGLANVLVFPDLNSGNIGYKLTERLAGARAIGPIILGTVQPCSDLSRGCSVEDIVDCTAFTVMRAQSREKKKPLINMEKYYANTRL